MPFLIGALGSTLPLLEPDDEELLDELESFLVSPHAARMSAVARTANAAKRTRVVRGRSDMVSSPPRGVGMTGDAAPPRRGGRGSDPARRRPAACRSRSGSSTTRWTG